MYLYFLGHVPGHLQTMEMYNEVMRINPAAFFLIPDPFKTQEKCIERVEADPWQLHHVPGYFKTQEISYKAVRDDLSFLENVPDWLMTQGQVKIRHGDNGYCNDNELIKWYQGYEKRKTQEAQIEKELMHITCHSSRWSDWCMSEDEKKQTKILRK